MTRITGIGTPPNDGRVHAQGGTNGSTHPARDDLCVRRIRGPVGVRRQLQLGFRLRRLRPMLERVVRVMQLGL